MGPWSKSSLDLKANSFCGECNSVLMENADRRALPLLRDMTSGATRSFSASEQAEVATWATMTALAQASAIRTPAIRESKRRYMAYAPRATA